MPSRMPSEVAESTEVPFWARKLLCLTTQVALHYKRSLPRGGVMAVERWLSAAGFVAALYASLAAGTPISQTLSPFNSGGSSGPFPLRVDVDTFSSIPMGESLISGSIAGTFGNATPGGGSFMR